MQHVAGALATSLCNAIIPAGLSMCQAGAGGSLGSDYKYGWLSRHCAPPQPCAPTCCLALQPAKEGAITLLGQPLPPNCILSRLVRCCQRLWPVEQSILLLVPRETA